MLYGWSLPSVTQSHFSKMTSILSARFADKLHVGSCEGKDHFFADNFSAAEIILLAKNGQAKIASRNFFGALFAPIFSRPQKWAEKRSEFFGP